MRFYSSLPPLCLWRNFFSDQAWLPGAVDSVGLQCSSCAFQLGRQVGTIFGCRPCPSHWRSCTPVPCVSLASPFLQGCQSKLFWFFLVRTVSPETKLTCYSFNETRRPHNSNQTIPRIRSPCSSRWWWSPTRTTSTSGRRLRGRSTSRRCCARQGWKKPAFF